MTPWTVAHQSSPSMGFSRQEYWSGLPFLSPGDLPHPGIEPRSPTLKADALPSEPPGKSSKTFFPLFLSLSFFKKFYFILLYNTALVLPYINMNLPRVYTWTPNPEPPSHLPLHTISLGHPSAPAPSILYPASNLDWWFISYMILYMFQCHSPKSSHPLPLPQSPKDCSIHLCLFCCLTYRVIVTIFLNSIYMH